MPYLHLLFSYCCCFCCNFICLLVVSSRSFFCFDKLQLYRTEMMNGSCWFSVGCKCAMCTICMLQCYIAVAEPFHTRNRELLMMFNVNFTSLNVVLKCERASNSIFLPEWNEKRIPNTVTLSSPHSIYLNWKCSMGNLRLNRHCEIVYGSVSNFPPNEICSMRFSFKWVALL